MKKILIIGCSGSGKSTLAKKLNQKLSLPVIGLDQHYWKPGWVRPPQEEWRIKMSKLVKQNEWIIDGNHQSTFDIRFPECDTIIWMDFNRLICFARTLRRRLFQDRVDPLDNCDERLDFKFIKWILWDYPTTGKTKIQLFLKQYSDKKIFVIKSKTDLKKFENQLQI